MKKLTPEEADAVLDAEANGTAKDEPPVHEVAFMVVRTDTGWMATSDLSVQYRLRRVATSDDVIEGLATALEFMRMQTVATITINEIIGRMPDAVKEVVEKALATDRLKSRLITPSR